MKSCGLPVAQLDVWIRVMDTCARDTGDGMVTWRHGDMVQGPEVTTIVWLPDQTSGVWELRL